MASGAWLLLAALQVSAVARLAADGKGGALPGVTAARRAEMVAVIQSLPKSVMLYSNRPEDLYILTGRLAQSLPSKLNATTDRLAPHYSADLLVVCHDLHRTRGQLVMFDDGTSRWPDDRELRALSLAPVKEGKGIRIYVPREQAHSGG
jgi:hypothetical protein